MQEFKFNGESIEREIPPYLGVKMDTFKESDLSYCINFEIETRCRIGIEHGFDTTLNQHDTFSSDLVYKTKNEAIDVAIKSLLALKDK